MFKKSYSVFAVSLVLAALSLPGFVLGQQSDSFVFLEFPSQVEVVVGSSTIKDVSVKNIGDYVKVVELFVETTAPVSVGVIPGSQQVDRGATGTFTLSFLTSPTNLINRYPSKLRLKGGGVEAEKDFTLIILPTPEKKFEINGNYITLVNKYEALQKRFSEVKDSGCVMVQPGDINAIAPKHVVDGLQTLNDKVEKTRIAIKEDDFVTADVEASKGKELANRVEADINRLRSAQEDCEGEKSRISSYLTGGVATTSIGIIVIVALLGFMAYRHYSSQPKVRRLIPSSYPVQKPSNSSTNLTHHPGVKRVERGFKYEFKKRR